MNHNDSTPSRLSRITRAFHAYGAWLVALSWARFVLLSLLAVIGAGLLQSVPPFSFRVPDALVLERESDEDDAREGPVNIKHGAGSYAIRINDQGIVIESPKASGAAASGAEAAADAGAISAATATEAGAPSLADAAKEPLHDGIRVDLGPEPAPQGSFRREAANAIDEAVADIEAHGKGTRRTRTHRFGDPLPELALLAILASAILKGSYRGRIAAEARAERATEAAEAEQLRRQVAEARMAAMQAQVEPHFLFNTLATIDHLIETDPPRASRMQKRLIALLRATLPAMRDGAATTRRTLGEELDVVTPYLEILEMRMEERLVARVDVPEGLRSAACPPMVLQVLVENAIRHGLEPKADGGTLTVAGRVVDGQLVLEVTDTGVGLGNAPRSAGAGTGLANVRERLALLYGNRADLRIEALTSGGTRAAIRIPYAVER